MCAGGTLAQLVEHRTENPGVPGSIPGGTTEYKPGLFGRVLLLYDCYVRLFDEHIFNKKYI